MTDLILFDNIPRETVEFGGIPYPGNRYFRSIKLTASWTPDTSDTMADMLPFVRNGRTKLWDGVLLGSTPDRTGNTSTISPVSTEVRVIAETGGQYVLIYATGAFGNSSTLLSLANPIAYFNSGGGQFGLTIGSLSQASV